MIAPKKPFNRPFRGGLKMLMLDKEEAELNGQKLTSEYKLLVH